LRCRIEWCERCVDVYTDIEALPVRGTKSSLGAKQNLGAGPGITEMVHDPARAPSRQTMRVASNEVG
jgi:hypothetical protein